MLRALCLLLAFQVLTASLPIDFGLQSLVKVGVLIGHFAHHVDGHGDHFDFASFLEQHYADDAHHQEDHGEHENFPFQHPHQDHHQQLLLSPFLLSHAVALDAPRYERAYSRSVITSAQDRASSSYLDSIWQPPRA